MSQDLQNLIGEVVEDFKSAHAAQAKERMCGNCEYFEPFASPLKAIVTGIPAGWCHRYPPVIEQLGQFDEHGNRVTETEWSQPAILDESDWCGEFRQLTTD